MIGKTESELVASGPVQVYDKHDTDWSIHARYLTVQADNWLLQRDGNPIPLPPCTLVCLEKIGDGWKIVSAEC